MDGRTRVGNGDIPDGFGERAERARCWKKEPNIHFVSLYFRSDLSSYIQLSRNKPPIRNKIADITQLWPVAIANKAKAMNKIAPIISQFHAITNIATNMKIETNKTRRARIVSPMSYPSLNHSLKAPTKADILRYTTKRMPSTLGVQKRTRFVFIFICSSLIITPNT
jgi:hypothetical protein